MEIVDLDEYPPLDSTETVVKGAICHFVSRRGGNIRLVEDATHRCIQQPLRIPSDMSLRSNLFAVVKKEKGTRVWRRSKDGVQQSEQT